MSEFSSSVASEKIHTVARIFTYLGWPILTFFGLMSVMTGLLVPVLFFSKSEEATLAVPAAGISIPILLAFTFLGFLYLRTAKRLRAGDRRAESEVHWLLVPMLFGFPVFTIAAIYCYALLSHYPAYLADSGVH